MRKLTERQRRAVSRLLRSTDGHMPMDRVLAKQLVKRGIVYMTGSNYDRYEWNRLVARLPIVRLLVTRETAEALVADGRQR